MLGCKQVGWDDERRLVEVGFTTSLLGKRVTGVDIDDVDQGQLDHRSDVLAVSTAGMLVRRDVWDHLGGPDPALTHARDDLDLCRRAHLAGHRVVVVPSAVVAHAEATASGRRRRSGRTTWPRSDRRDALHLRLAGSPAPVLPFVLLWTVLAAALRALGRLALKQPDRAADELAALVAVLVRPASWLRTRGRLRIGRAVPVRAVRRLHAAPRLVIRQRRDAVSAHLRAQETAWLEVEETRRQVEHQTRAARPEPAGGPRADHAVIETGPVPQEAESMPAGPGRRLPAPWIAAAVAVLPALAAALVGLGGLLRGGGAVLSPYLLPMPQQVSTLWQAGGSGWRQIGLGAAAFADPLTTVLAVLGLPFGSPRTAVLLLTVLGVPLAAFTAWLAAGVVTSSRALRAWAGLTWAAAPSLLIATGSGRIGAVLAHLLLPLVALGVARAVGVGNRWPGRGSLAAASGAGLVLTVVLAAAPALAVPALIAVLAVLAVARCGRALLGWTVALPIVLLLPWWMAVARHPRLLLAEPGLPTGGAADPQQAIWQLLLMPADPGDLLLDGHRPFSLVPRMLSWLPGADPVTVVRGLAVALVAPALVLGLAALLRPGQHALAAAAAWVAALGGLTVAILAPRLWVAPVIGGGSRGWWGPGMSMMLLGVLAAVLCRLDGASGRLRRRSLGARHGIAVGLGALMVLGPLVTLAAWAWHGHSSAAASRDRAEVARAGLQTPGGAPVRRGDPVVLPAVAAAEAQGPAGTRTLVLRVAGSGVRWNLARSAGPEYGAGSAALAARIAERPEVGRADERVVLPVLGSLLSDSGADVRDRLAELAVGSVLLLPPLDDASVLALDASPGLLRVGTANGAVLWRVELTAVGDAPSRPVRVRVVGQNGVTLQALPSNGLEVSTSLPAGPAGRAVVLAERADPGWHALLDGRELVPAQRSGWAQAFLLPTDGGHLTIEHRVRGQHPLELARWATLALGLLAAIPIPSRRRRVLIAARTPRAARPATGRRSGTPGGRRRPASRSHGGRGAGPGRSLRRRSGSEQPLEPAFELPDLPAGSDPQIADPQIAEPQVAEPQVAELPAEPIGPEVGR